MEDNNNKRKNTVFTALIVIALMIITAGVSYAYFSSNLTNEAKVETKVKTAKYRDEFISSGQVEISLDVTNAKMQEVDGKDDYSSAITDSKTFTVSLKAGSGKATCTYDLAVSSSGDPYTKSTTVGALNEYTIKGEDNGVNTAKQSFAEINIDSALASLLTSQKTSPEVTTGILGNFTISDQYDGDGVSQTATVQTWTIDANFYNLAKDQNAQLNKSFVHEIKVVNVSCTNVD